MTENKRGKDQQRSVKEKRNDEAPVTIEHALQDVANLERLLSELASSAQTVSSQLIQASVQNQYMMALHWACRITLDDDALDAAQDDQEQAMAQIDAFRATKLPENATLDQSKLLDPAVIHDTLFDANLVTQLLERARQRLGALAQQLPQKSKVAPAQGSHLAGVKIDSAAAAALASVSPLDISHPDSCSSCGKLPAESLCGRCKSRRYCGVDCQRKDWPVHKVVCKSPSVPQ